jgi:hypothetical protein
MTIHFYRVPRVRIDGSIPPLTRTPSWRAQEQPDSWSMSKPPFLPDIISTLRTQCSGGVHIPCAFTREIYRVFQKELYKFESL